jgi:hypothetical protein
VPDADTRHALLLILAVLERHSRALRTLLAQAGHPELKGLLGDFERRERALREAAWELRSLEACRATGPSRRNGGDAGPARQGVLPLPELNGTTDADATARVIPSVVERRSENLGTGRPMASATAWTTKGMSSRTREAAVREALRTRACRR